MPVSPGTLILICGLPGSGKTTVAKRLATERGAIRMCADDWIEAILATPDDVPERDRLRDPIENLQWDLAQDYLRLGITVILENGFWAAEERDLYAMGAWDLAARVELVYMEAPDLGKLWERVSKRNSELASPTFRMSQEEVLAAWKQFQPPSDEELSFYDDGYIVPWTD